VKQVSLYVPAFNAESSVGRCLEAVLKQSYPVDEVLVIDDGSQDRTAEVANRLGVRVVEHGANRGLAASRNTGIAESRGEYIAAVDSDCVVEETWLEVCMGAFDRPGVAAVGGRLLERDADSGLGVWRAAHLKHHWGERQAVNPAFLSGSNIVLRRDALGLVGPYDERFRSNYEDVDLSLRLMGEGLDSVYEPRAVAWHIRQDTVRTLLRTYWAWHVHLHEGRVLRRACFHLSRSLEMLMGDLGKGRFGCAMLDALTLPTSVYLDVARLNGRRSTHADGG